MLVNPESKTCGTRKKAEKNAGRKRNISFHTRFDSRYSPNFSHLALKKLLKTPAKIKFKSSCPEQNNHWEIFQTVFCKIIEKDNACLPAKSGLY